MDPKTDPICNAINVVALAEKNLRKEKEKNERRAFGHLEENLHSFIIAIESLLQSVHPFLVAEDILQGAPSKEFFILIFEDPQVRWLLTLKFADSGKKWGCWPLLGGVDQSFPVGYGLTVECSFGGGKLYEDIIGLVNENYMRLDLVTPRLENIIREHNGFEMANKAFTIFELQKEIYAFFRMLLVDKVGIQTADYVFAVNQKLCYLLQQFSLIYKQFLANKNAVQSFQCLAHDTATDLKDTKSFVKSKKLAQIREGLERRSRDIVVEINK